MNLPDDDVWVVTWKVSEARKLSFEDDALADAVDVAQGSIFMGQKKRAYVLIEIEAEEGV